MKKVRGFTRKVRSVERRCTPLDPLSIEYLQRYHYDYAKLGLGPFHWHRWHGRRPPRVVRRLAADQLLRTLFTWLPTLHNQPEPFYLAVWLVDTEFAHVSQVVAAVEERISWYEDLFGAPVADGPPLPAEYRQLPGAEKLTWTTHPHVAMLDTFTYPDGWPARELRRPHWYHTAENGDEYLIVQVGWTWVGQLPPA